MVHVTIGKGDKGYELVLTVTDSTGSARDLSLYTVALQCWKPSAPDTYIVNAAGASTAPTTGIVHYTLASTDFTSAAYYEGQLVLSAAGLQDTVETFLIAVPGGTYYTSIAELKDELNITGSDHDYQLQGLVSQSQKFIDSYCKRTFVPGTAGVVKYYDGAESPLWIDDCTAITAIALDEESDGTWSTSMAATDWLLKPYNTNPKTMLVLSPNSDYGSFCSGVTKGVKITGTWGYDTTVPEDIRRAAIIQCCRWFKRADTAYASALGPTELGVIQTFSGLDPDIKMILSNGDYVKTQWAR
jgi:hypothetical protein